MVDSQVPVVLAKSFNPTPGPDLDRCEITLSVEVKDPAYSCGLDRVEAKHSVPSGTPDHHYFTFGGTGGYDADMNWVGTFSGTIDVMDVSQLETLKIYFKVYDCAGNHSSWDGPYTYTLNSTTDCN
jgi:hypothetical protein